MDTRIKNMATRIDLISEDIAHIKAFFDGGEKAMEHEEITDLTRHIIDAESAVFAVRATVVRLERREKEKAEA